MGSFSGPKIINDNLVLNLDAANPKSYSPNVHPSPLDIWGWIGGLGGGANSAVLSRDTTITDSPAGGTPMKMAQAGTDAYTGTYGAATWNLTPAVVGQTWTVSCWVKASAPVVIEGPWIAEANSAGAYLGGGGAFDRTIGTGWTRLSGTHTLVNPSTAFIQTRMDGSNPSATVNIWWDGLQVERSSTPTTFNPKTNTNGTNWYDLSGNGHDITIGPSVTFVNTVGKGVLNFPQDANGYGRNTSLNLATSNFTVMSFVRKNTIGGTGRTITAYNNNWLLGHHDSTYGDYYAMGWVNDVAAPPSDTTWRVFTGTGNIPLDVYQLYINDALIVQNSAGAEGPNGWNLNNQYGQYSDCQISNLICYNRVLSASEIQQNFNALRGRFGI